MLSKDYYNKYLKYKTKYNNTKPGKNLDDTLKQYIEGVHKNIYKYGYENPLFQMQLNKNLNCSDRNNLASDNEEDSKFMVYDKENNLKLGCFKIAQNNENYIFKSTLKGQMTDIFINSLGDKLFEVFSLRIIDIMNEMVEYYIQIFNQNITYQLKDDDVVYLYKGGNIIRIYIDEMLGNISSSIIQNCMSDKGLKNITDVMTTIKSKQKYGDWDMIIYINPDLDTNLYKKIEKDLNKILLPIIDSLKGEFTNLIFNKFSHNFLDFLSKVQHSYFEDEDFKKIITDYDNTLVLNNIKTFDYEIKKNSICKKNFTDLQKNSFVTLDKPGTSEKNYIELENLLVENNSRINTQQQNRYIPGVGITVNDLEFDTLFQNEKIFDETSDKIFITQSQALVVVRNFKIPFTISRLKVNNISTLLKEGKELHIGLPFELIDAVVLDQFDSQGEYIHHKLEQYHKPLYSVLNYYGKKLKLPSIYYLYYDLEAILMRQNVFIWEDKKYGKRLLRLILIALYASLNDKIKVSEVLSNVKTILQLFTSISGNSNHQKLFAVKNFYNINANNIELNNNLKIKYFGELVEHYIHCLICIDAVTNKQVTNNKYAKKVFETNINYKPIPGTLFLTKPMHYYYQINLDEYYQKLSEYETEVINYLQLIIVLLDKLPQNEFKFKNDIIKI